MRGMRSSRIRDLLRRFAHDHRGRSLEIVSYDVSGHDNATAVAVAHYVFGRKDQARLDGGSKEYLYLDSSIAPGSCG